MTDEHCDKIVHKNHRVRYLSIQQTDVPTCEINSTDHGLFTNGWETRSRDVWKPVRNRTPGIISKICKLAGGTPALLRPLGPYKISHGLIWGKMTPAR